MQLGMMNYFNQLPSLPVVRLAKLQRHLVEGGPGPGHHLGGDLAREEQEHDEAGAALQVGQELQAGVPGEQQQSHQARHNQHQHQHQL